MSVSKWNWSESCEDDYCCGDCDQCEKERGEQVTYKSKRALEEKYDISASLTNKLLDEMRQAGIYGQFKIVSDSFLRINAEAFDHFIKNRHAIKHGLKYEPYKEASD